MKREGGLSSRCCRTGTAPLPPGLQVNINGRAGKDSGSTMIDIPVPEEMIRETDRQTGSYGRADAPGKNKIQDP